MRQAERPVFQEVTVSAILSENVYMYTCVLDGCSQVVTKFRQDCLKQRVKHYNVTSRNSLILF